MTGTGKRMIWLGAALGALGGLAWALWPTPPEVATVAVSRGPLVASVSAEGRTRVKSLYAVAAPVDGELERIAVEAGDAISPGAVLARIHPLAARPLDPRSRAEATAAAAAARAEVARADATVKAAEVQVTHAESELARSRELARTGTGPAAAAEHAQHEADRSRSALEAARAAAREARAEKARAEAVLGTGAAATSPAATVVSSPMAGSVLRVLHESAGPVAAGTPLVELGDVGDLEIVAEVLTGDALSVRPGAAAIARWGNGQEVAATVRRVEPAAFTKVSALGLEEQRVRVLLDLAGPTPAGLGHDYRVDVAIVTSRSARVLRVPATATFRVGKDWAVFVVEGGRARVVRVQIGPTDGDFVAIQAGLREGDQVIAQPTDDIDDGKRVSPTRS